MATGEKSYLGRGEDGEDTKNAAADDAGCTVATSDGTGAGNGTGSNRDDDHHHGCNGDVDDSAACDDDDEEEEEDVTANFSNKSGYGRCFSCWEKKDEDRPTTGVNEHMLKGMVTRLKTMTMKRVRIMSMREAMMFMV